MASPKNTEVTKREVVQWHFGRAAETKPDLLACEEPLEIRVDTHSVSITMRTPGHDDELAIGFLLSEGLIAKRGDILGVQPWPRNRIGNVVDVFTASDIQIDFTQLTRHVFASSSCGMCGKATIDSVHQNFPPVNETWRIGGRWLLELPEQMRQAQETFNRTGGLHAAGIFNRQGDLIASREDVGRHNAIDKALGQALLTDRFPLSDALLVVSGRASFEILQKALAGGISVVVAISAPSSLAVQFAQESGITLVGFVRGERMNIYSHPERIEL